MLLELIKPRAESIFSTVFPAKVMFTDDVKAFWADHNSPEGEEGSLLNSPHPCAPPRRLQILKFLFDVFRQVMLYAYKRGRVEFLRMCAVVVLRLVMITYPAT